MTNIIFRDGIKALNRSATISFYLKAIHCIKFKALNADRQHFVVQFERIDIAVVLQSGVAAISVANNFCPDFMYFNVLLLSVTAQGISNHVMRSRCGRMPAN